VGRLQGAALGDKLAIEDSRYKFLVSVIRRSEWWIQLHKPDNRGRIGGNIGRRTWWELKMTDSRSFRSVLQTRS